MLPGLNNAAVELLSLESGRLALSSHMTLGLGFLTCRMGLRGTSTSQGHWEGLSMNELVNVRAHHMVLQTSWLWLLAASGVWTLNTAELEPRAWEDAATPEPRQPDPARERAMAKPALLAAGALRADAERPGC